MTVYDEEDTFDRETWTEEDVLQLAGQETLEPEEEEEWEKEPEEEPSELEEFEPEEEYTYTAYHQEVEEEGEW